MADEVPDYPRRPPDAVLNRAFGATFSLSANCICIARAGFSPGREALICTGCPALARVGVPPRRHCPKAASKENRVRFREAISSAVGPSVLLPFVLGQRSVDGGPANAERGRDGGDWPPLACILLATPVFSDRAPLDARCAARVPDVPPAPQHAVRGPTQVQAQPSWRARQRPCGLSRSRCRYPPAKTAARCCARQAPESSS